MLSISCDARALRRVRERQVLGPWERAPHRGPTSKHTAGERGSGVSWGTPGLPEEPALGTAEHWPHTDWEGRWGRGAAGHSWEAGIQGQRCSLNKPSSTQLGPAFSGSGDRGRTQDDSSLSRSPPSWGDNLGHRESPKVERWGRHCFLAVWPQASCTPL